MRGNGRADPSFIVDWHPLRFLGWLSGASQRSVAILISREGDAATVALVRHAIESVVADFLVGCLDLRHVSDFLDRTASAILDPF
jgi:hypothetical protein